MFQFLFYFISVLFQFQITIKDYNHQVYHWKISVQEINLYPFNTKFMEECFWYAHFTRLKLLHKSVYTCMCNPHTARLFWTMESWKTDATHILCSLFLCDMIFTNFRFVYYRHCHANHSYNSSQPCDKWADGESCTKQWASGYNHTCQFADSSTTTSPPCPSICSCCCSSCCCQYR